MIEGGERQLSTINEYRKSMAEFRTSRGGACELCGATDRLEFDHIDRNSKAFGIGRGWSLARERVLEEIAKCQLLCRSCHVTKSLACGDMVSAQHGGHSMYRRHGCRCDLCCSGNLERGRKYKGSKPRLDPKHGSSNMYSHLGCRCAVCREGQASRQRAYRQKKSGFRDVG